MVHQSPVHRRAAIVCVSLAVVGLAACDSGSSSAKPKPNRTTTTTRRRHGTTTSSSSSSTTSSSTTTIPTTPSTSVPPTTPTTAPPNTGNCGARAGAIYAAVQGGGLGPVQLANYTIANCRVSTSNPIWSAVTLVPNAGSGQPQLTVALQRLGATWNVEAYGQNHVACSAPPPVPAELQLGC